MAAATAAALSGGRKGIFLVTGPPGVGKTTLIMRVLESLKLSNPNLNIQGFYTREVRGGRGGNQRVGFEVVSLDGRKAPLSSISSESELCLMSRPDWPTVGKYRVDIQSFESVALPELQVRKGTHLFIIDEVGKMELFSQSFFPAVLRLLQSNIPLLASIPLGHHIPQVERLRSHPGAQIFTLNQRNRDAVKDDIYMQLLQALDVASV
ncbi:Cancer-related nucleoside-triphosphatase homolog [Linum perenne]